MMAGCNIYCRYSIINCNSNESTSLIFAPISLPAGMMRLQASAAIALLLGYFNILADKTLRCVYCRVQNAFNLFKT